MKKLLFIIAAALLLGAYACKTNEANYRDAYEKAKEKQTDTGDSLTTAMLRQSDQPKMTLIGGDTLPARTFAIAAKVDAGSEEGVKKYCVVVGKFRQIFNASSMCSRLQETGYPDACVVHDRQKYYFVIASSTNVAAEVALLMQAVIADKSIVLQQPFPYILRPAHLVR